METYFSYKFFLGMFSIAMALISYIPYIHGIIKDKIKPHAFSWLTWGLLTGIAYFGQLSDGGGFGALVTGVTSLGTLAIAFLAFFKGEKEITRSDKISFIGAMLSLFLWWWTSNPLGAMILVTLIDALGFYPTFRKSFVRPNEESTLLFFLSGLKFVFALFALENYTVVTWLYPMSLVLMNWLFVAMVMARRRSSHPT